MSIKLSILGCGKFGCAVKPPVELEREDEPHKDTYLAYVNKEKTDIGKIFKMNEDCEENRDYRDELKELNEMKTIDINHIFTVPFKGASIGYINEEKYSTSSLDEVFDSLDYDKNNGENKVHQIVLGHGGLELNDDIFENYKQKKTITYKKFINIFDTFLEGMLLLQKAKKVHRDIKPPNVLFDGKKLNLIDFGLSQNFDNLYSFNRDNIHIMNFVYVFFPPEYHVCGVIYKTIRDHINHQIKKEEEENKSARFKIKTIINDTVRNKRFEDLKCKDSQFVIDALETFKKKTGSVFNSGYIDFISRKNDSIFLTTYKKFFHLNIHKFIDELIFNIKQNDDEYIKDVLSKIYDTDVKEKFDVYSLAYIILPFYKHLSTLQGKNKLNVKQELFLSYIFNCCSVTNPSDRISLKNLKKVFQIEKENDITSISQSSSLSNSSSVSSPLPSLSPMSSSSSNGGFKKTSKTILPSSHKINKVAAQYTNMTNFMDHIKFDYRSVKLFQKKR